MHFSIAIVLGVIMALVALGGVAAACLLGANGAAQVATTVQNMTGVTLGTGKAKKLLVMTDIHYISQKLTDNGSYFTNMVMDGDGKTMLVMQELADAFFAQVLQEQPDALIISGDITFNGERQSHLDFAEQLTQITDAGIAVYVIPGNHDLNYRYAASFEGDSYTMVDSVTPAEFREIYAGFGYGGETLLAADENSLSYMALLGDEQALLCIDVNSDITGVISDDIVAWAEEQLIAAQQAGLQVVAVSHQSLMDHNSMLSFGYTIVKGEKLLALYEKYGVFCNLSGHIHMQHIATSEGGVADIATSALSVYPNQFGMIEWSTEALSYETKAVDMPLWEELEEARTMGYESFAAYSLAFFQSNHSGQFAEALGDDYTTEEIAAMSDWASETNAYYFAGRRDLIAENQEALTALAQSGVFFGTYLSTIFEDDFSDDTQWAYLGDV